MMRTNILSAKAATGIGNVISVADYKNLYVTMATASSANLTVKCQGSFSLTKPDFTATASPSNSWDYVAMIYMMNDQVFIGTDGIAFTGTDACYLFKINSDLQWLTFNVTARSAGSVTVDLLAINNA